MKDREGGQAPDNSRLVRLWSFGARDGRGHNIPTAAKLVDCLQLRNPHGRMVGEKDGLSREVQAFVRDDVQANHPAWWSKVVGYCMNTQNVSERGRILHDADLPPSDLHVHDLARDPRPVLDVAFFCFGGRHRSVACAELLARELRTAGIEVETYHTSLRVRQKLLGTKRSYV